MNADVKEQWIEALRSGEYTQVQGLLHYGGGFCCLGVLCDLHAKAKGTDWRSRDGRGYAYLGARIVLPSKVVAWADLGSNNPLVDTASVRAALSELNDDYEMSFDQIADVIEAL